MRAVVTGASAGIGAAFAKRPVAKGYDVTVVARPVLQRLRAAETELVRGGRSATLASGYGRSQSGR